MTIEVVNLKRWSQYGSWLKEISKRTDYNLQIGDSDKCRKSKEDLVGIYYNRNGSGVFNHFTDIIVENPEDKEKEEREEEFKEKLIETLKQDS